MSPTPKEKQPARSSHRTGRAKKSAGVTAPVSLAATLTKSGHPRKNKAGRPIKGRTVNSPKITPKAQAMLLQILGVKPKLQSQSDALEWCIELAHRTLALKAPK